MKKLLYFLLFGFFFFVFQGVTLFADDFSDCLDLERLKAKSDGATAKESIDQAERVCKIKFKRDSNTGKEKSANKETGADTKGGATEVSRPKFALDFMFGSKQVRGIDEKCQENGPDFYVDSYCERHPANAILIDLYINPQFSIALGSLTSSFEHPNSDSVVSLNFTTSEISIGGRFHLKKGQNKKGLDLFVGAGSVTIEACNKYEINYRDEEITRLDICEKKERGGYSEGGIKYVTRAGFSVGYYLRASSPEKYGGNTSGVTLGWTW